MITIEVNKKTRMVNLSKSFLGNELENLQEKLIFKFDDVFVDGQARLEYEHESEKNYIILNKEEDSYTIPVKNILTKRGQITMQLVITEGTDEKEIPVFKSNKFYLFCNESINAVEEAPDGYELWIEQANTKLNQMDNLNIDGEKQNNVTTIRITKKDGTVEELQILDGEKGDKGDTGAPGQIKYIIAQSLPTENIDKTALYFVPKKEPEKQDMYDEYAWLEENNDWEFIGTKQIKVDLTDYAKIEYVNNVASGINHDIENLTELMTEAQDDIDNLEHRVKENAKLYKLSVSVNGTSTLSMTIDGDDYLETVIKPFINDVMNDRPALLCLEMYRANDIAFKSSAVFSISKEQIIYRNAYDIVLTFNAVPINTTRTVDSVGSGLVSYNISLIGNLSITFKSRTGADVEKVQINSIKSYCLLENKDFITTNNTTPWTPTQPYGAVHKKYVDDAIDNAGGGGNLDFIYIDCVEVSANPELIEKTKQKLGDAINSHIGSSFLVVLNRNSMFQTSAILRVGGSSIGKVIKENETVGVVWLDGTLTALSNNIIYSMQISGKWENGKYIISDCSFTNIGGSGNLSVLTTNNATLYNPTPGSYNPATTKYVDEKIGNIDTLLDHINGEVIQNRVSTLMPNENHLVIGENILENDTENDIANLLPNNEGTMEIPVKNEIDNMMPEKDKIVEVI